MPTIAKAPHAMAMPMVVAVLDEIRRVAFDCEYECEFMVSPSGEFETRRSRQLDSL